MRWSARVKVGNITLYGMVSHTQTLKGITNKIFSFAGDTRGMGKDRFFVVWDLEGYTETGVTLEKVCDELRRIQQKYDLSDVFITSDKPEVSWHGWCFSVVDWKKYLMIILDTKYVDYNFFYWTVHRGEATIRVSPKKGRVPEKVVAMLRSDVPYAIPEKVKEVIYDTSLEKRGEKIVLEL